MRQGSFRQLLFYGLSDFLEESDELALFGGGQPGQHALCSGNPALQRRPVKSLPGSREGNPDDAAVLFWALALHQLPPDETVDHASCRAKRHPNARGE
jgi:hypothetical protein